MSMSEAYRNLHAAERAKFSPAEQWERDRLAHWKLMREAWLRYNALVAAHEAQGYNERNPHE